MSKKNVLILLSLFVSFGLQAQVADSAKKTAPPVSISGSVDLYYRYNFNNPKNYPYNSLTSFTHSNNSFELGMASLRADHSFGKISACIDLGFGRRAEEFAYNDAGTRLAIKQVYVTYNLSSAVKITMGSWATHLGYELLDPYLNRNYSMSYMFTNGPFSHTGLKADIGLGGKSAFMVGVANPTDFRSASAMPKSVIAQFSTGTKDDKLKAYFNFVGGKQSEVKKVIQGDIVATYMFSNKFVLGINGTLQSVKLDVDSTGNFKTSNWEGLALYANYDPFQWLGFTLRTEYIADANDYLGLKNAFAPTLSANFKIDNLLIIPEFRFDRTGNAVFYKNSSASGNETASFIIAVSYHF